MWVYQLLPALRRDYVIRSRELFVFCCAAAAASVASAACAALQQRLWLVDAAIGSAEL
jgi:hypothetical protein